MAAGRMAGAVSLAAICVARGWVGIFIGASGGVHPYTAEPQ